jgi:hypothetical protein
VIGVNSPDPRYEGHAQEKKIFLLRVAIRRFLGFVALEGYSFLSPLSWSLVAFVMLMATPPPDAKRCFNTDLLVTITLRMVYALGLLSQCALVASA